MCHPRRRVRRPAGCRALSVRCVSRGVKVGWRELTTRSGTSTPLSVGRSRMCWRVALASVCAFERSGNGTSRARHGERGREEAQHTRATPDARRGDGTSIRRPRRGRALRGEWREHGAASAMERVRGRWRDVTPWKNNCGSNAFAARRSQRLRGGADGVWQVGGRCGPKRRRGGKERPAKEEGRRVRNTAISGGLTCEGGESEVC